MLPWSTLVSPATSISEVSASASLSRDIFHFPSKLGQLYNPFIFLLQ